jgi:hypothetical protein
MAQKSPKTSKNRLACGKTEKEKGPEVATKTMFPKCTQNAPKFGPKMRPKHPQISPQNNYIEVKKREIRGA